MSNEPTVKRWTAKRKAAVVMDIFKGKTTIAEVALELEAIVVQGDRQHGDYLLVARHDELNHALLAAA